MLGESRQNLADETGLCLKSISRAIKKFQAEQLIVQKRQSDLQSIGSSTKG